jgi:2-dehydropantoate 2-reductase
VRVCVFGAGAIGGHLAGRLAKGGAEVSVVARGAHLAAIRAHGLTVRATDGEIHATLAASDDPAALGQQDAVIVTVKAPALPAVAAGIGPLLGPKTKVVFAMNGIPWFYFHAHGGALDGTRLPNVDPGDAVWNAVGPQRAAAGVVYSACAVTEPGVVHVENRSKLTLGEPDGAISPEIEALAGVLRQGGLDIDLSPRIRDMIWRKLLLNLASGPLSVLGQANVNDAHSEPATEAAARAALAEGMAVARAMGCDIMVDADRMMAANRGMQHKPSILQDLELGRPMEVAALYDAPLDLARRVGVPTPTLDLLVALVRIRARAAGLYSG